MSRLPFLAVLLLLSLSTQDVWELELETPAPVDADIHGPLANLDGLTCLECHATIADEWAQTLHAHAWLDPRYVKGLKGKRRPQSCHGCHAPEPLHLAETFGRKPKPRAEDTRHLGIACQSCHLGPNDTILGPFGVETEAHASVRSPSFVGSGSNALCISCHRTNIGPVVGIARDFEEADLGARGMSCVGCHMAPVERAIANERGSPEELGTLAARPGRSHLLQTPRDPSFLAQAFAFEARVEGTTTVVTVRNRAGHRVPGLIGRELRLTASAGEDGDVTAETVLDHDAYLPLEGSLTLRLSGVHSSVRLRGIHAAPHLDAPVPFLERELPVTFQ